MLDMVVEHVIANSRIQSLFSERKRRVPFSHVAHKTPTSDTTPLAQGIDD